MESWGDKFRREHPWLWRRAIVLDWFERIWDWIADRPYNLPDGHPDEGLYYVGRRTGKPYPPEED